MNLNMQIGKKNKKQVVAKGAYPTKRSINLFYMVDKSARPATMVVYGILVLVLVLALGKFGVYDFMVKVNDAEAEVASYQEQLDDKTLELMDFKNVKEQFSRYSYGYLSDDEAALVDRLDMLDLIEEKLMSETTVDSVTISGNDANISLTCSSLAQLSRLQTELLAADIVSGVSVRSADAGEDDEGAGKMSATLMISFTKPEGGDAK